MRFKKLVVFLFLLIGTARLDAQEKLTGLDSLYLSSISDFYAKAEKNRGKIWKGMELGPVCMFRVNGPALLYNHPNPPTDFKKVTDKLYVGNQKSLQLFGATQTEINGVLTAIADYGLSRYASTDEAYAELFHELHHVYQRNSVKRIKFDNPAVLLRYPENYRNDAIKLLEQNTLFKMTFEEDNDRFRKLLNQFYTCRLKREQLIDDFMNYEEAVESMEGPAFYCEYKFYNIGAPVQALQTNYNHKHFFAFLTTPYYGRDNLRNRHLAAGMAMSLLLDKHFSDWQTEYYAGDLSLYDFFVSKFKPQPQTLEIDPSLYDVSRFHTQQVIAAHEASYDDFNSQPGTRITLVFKKRPQFKGFDPMHAESINDSTILHKTMLRLSGGEENSLFINNEKVVTKTDGQVWFVSKVVLFVPRDAVTVKDGRIIINAGGKSISWTGKLKSKTEKELVFECQ